MKYSTQLTTDEQHINLRDDLRVNIPQPQFPRTRSSAPLKETSHALMTFDEFASPAPSLYQLVSKRKLTPEFMASRGPIHEEVGLCENKRARLDMNALESSVGVQERLASVKEKRSRACLPNERHSTSSYRKFVLNPPLLEPIVVRKEINHMVFPSEQMPSPGMPHLFPHDDRIFRDYNQMSAMEKLQPKNGASFDKNLTFVQDRSFSDDSGCLDGNGRFSSYYNFYQRLVGSDGARGPPIVKTEGHNDIQKTSVDIHQRMDFNRMISEHPGYHHGYPSSSESKAYKDIGSPVIQTYQKFGQLPNCVNNTEEFKKFTERDKFHETVDQILHSRKNRGLSLNDGYLKNIIPSGQTLHSKKSQLSGGLPTTDKQGSRPLPKFHSSTSSVDIVKPTPIGNFGQSMWHKVPDNNHGKKTKHVSRSDENRRLFQKDSTGKESSAIISLAIRRIGRGRFGVLECLNNFAHRMYHVEKNWKTFNKTEAFKVDIHAGKNPTSENSPVESIKSRSGPSNYTRYNSSCSNDGGDYDDAAPLDLSKAVVTTGVKEDVTSPCSFVENDDARLPIKKRMGKYRSLSEEDTSQSAVAGYNQLLSIENAFDSSTTTTDPKVRIEMESFESAQNGKSQTDERGSDVILQRRLCALIETPDGDGNLPLHLAVMKNDLHVTTALVREMNLRNMSLDRYNHKKQTPLHLAIKRENIDIVRILLKGSSSCNIPDGCGNTGIHLAIEVHNFDIFSSICLNTSVPIDVTSVNKEGLTILDMTELNILPNNYLTLLMSSQLVDCNNNIHKINKGIQNINNNVNDDSNASVIVVCSKRFASDSSMEERFIDNTLSSDCYPKGQSMSFVVSDRKSSDGMILPSSPVIVTKSPICSTSSSAADPLIVPSCLPGSPPSSPSSLSSTPSPISLTIKSLRPQLPLARSCLPLLQSSSASSSSLSSTYVDNYSSNALSLYAAC